MFKQLVQHVWEFKQIKDLHLRIVAPHNLFIEFMHEVRSNPTPHGEYAESL